MNRPNAITKSGTLKVTWIGVRVLWYLGWFAAALSVALFLATALTSFHVKYVQLPLSVTFDDAAVIGPTAKSGTLPIVGYSGRVMVEGENLRGQAYWLMIPMLLIGGYLWIVHLLDCVLRTIRNGTPFMHENPKRLRMIGYILAIGGPLIGVSNHIYGRVHVNQLDIPQAALDVPIDVYPFVVFAGLVILVIAQVFDHGLRLQAEQDLTV